MMEMEEMVGVVVVVAEDNDDHEGGSNGSSVNITRDSRGVNRKTMATCKYMHSVRKIQ